MHAYMTLYSHGWVAVCRSEQLTLSFHMPGAMSTPLLVAAANASLLGPLLLPLLPSACLKPPGGELARRAALPVPSVAERPKIWKNLPKSDSAQGGLLLLIFTQYFTPGGQGWGLLKNPSYAVFPWNFVVRSTPDQRKQAWQEANNGDACNVRLAMLHVKHKTPPLPAYSALINHCIWRCRRSPWSVHKARVSYLCLLEWLDVWTYGVAPTHDAASSFTCLAAMGLPDQTGM